MQIYNPFVALYQIIQFHRLSLYLNCSVLPTIIFALADKIKNNKKNCPKVLQLAIIFDTIDKVIPKKTTTAKRFLMV